MTWAHWVLILLPPLWAGLMWRIAFGPLLRGDSGIGGAVVPQCPNCGRTYGSGVYCHDGAYGTLNDEPFPDGVGWCQDAKGPGRQGTIRIQPLEVLLEPYTVDGDQLAIDRKFAEIIQGWRP